MGKNAGTEPFLDISMACLAFLYVFGDLNVLCGFG
jgi:hypothetical protein